MAEKQAEIEDIQRFYGDECKQLKELEQRFNDLEVDYNSIMEERRIQVREISVIVSCTYFHVNGH